jgi:hypothetical protein
LRPHALDIKASAAAWATSFCPAAFASGYFGNVFQY